MPLTDSQVEQQLTQRRLDVQDLQSTVTQLQAAISQLQATINSTKTTSTSTPTIGATLDSYVYPSGILHKLSHLFQNAVTVAGDFIVSGITKLQVTYFPSLTASRPLKLNSGGQVVGDKIDLSAANDVTGITPVGNGGTGVNGLTAHSILIGGATVSSVSPVAAGKVLMDNGPGADPGYTTLSFSSITGTVANAQLPSVVAPGTTSPVTSITVDAQGRITAIS